MIKYLLDDIAIAAHSKAYLSALALAMTLPDICGKIQYNITEDKRGHKHYIKWFDSWVKPRLPNELFTFGNATLAFDGADCYALRCAFLHAGNTDFGKKKSKIEKFELCVCDGELQFGETVVCNMPIGTPQKLYVCFNVLNLIEAFISGCNAYLNEYGDSSDLYGSIEVEHLDVAVTEEVQHERSVI